jgi:hypothetical protein
MSVPNCFRIDDDHWSISALIEAPGLVDADFFFQAKRSNLLPHGAHDFLATLHRTALSSRADKDVFFVDAVAHGANYRINSLEISQEWTRCKFPVSQRAQNLGGMSGFAVHTRRKCGLRLMPCRSLYQVLLVLLLLPSPAVAKHVHVPKHCPVKLHSGSVDTVFSTPDAQSDVVPAFVGKKGQPINSDMEPRLAGFDHARLLTDLTKDQQKQIKTLQDGTNMTVQAMQEHINVLNQRLDVLKAHPHEKVIVQEQQLPDTDQIKSEIAQLRKNIQEKRRDASQQLETILSEEQLDRIKRMRRGELMHEISERKESEK